MTSCDSRELRHAWPAFCFTVVVWLAATAPAAAAESVNLPTNVFADSDISLPIPTRGAPTVPWQVLVHNQTLARGAAQVVDGRATIRFCTPHVKPHATLHATLQLQLAAGGVEHKIAVLDRDVLSDRRRWAEELAITLFDPAGNTARALELIELPYRQLTNLGSLANVTDGIVIVGEGVDFRNQRGLDQTLYDVANRGVPVLLLAPAAGYLAMPTPAPDRFELRGITAGRLIAPTLIGDLDWKTGFALAEHSGEIVLQTSDPPQGYAWVDLRFNTAASRLTAIGWRLLDRWDDSPAPRYFLIELIESLSRDEHSARRQ